MPPLSIPILQGIAYRNRWTTCTTPSGSGAGGVVHPSLLFTDYRHPGTLRADFDGPSDIPTAVLLSVDCVDADALAAAFPGWPTDGNILHLPVDPPQGTAFLDTLLPPVLATLADLASNASTSLPLPPVVAGFATTRRQLILARNGQGIYRERLLALWGNACAVTGLANPDFIRASHAKPWRDSTDAERLDPSNGLPLIPNLDHLFDDGWISFAGDGSILLSPDLSPSAASALGVTPFLRLRLPLSSAQQSYLSFHRAHVFRSRST